MISFKEDLSRLPGWYIEQIALRVFFWPGETLSGSSLSKRWSWTGDKTEVDKLISGIRGSSSAKDTNKSELSVVMRAVEGDRKLISEDTNNKRERPTS
jgi:hypothetical protein